MCTYFAQCVWVEQAGQTLHTQVPHALGKFLIDLGSNLERFGINFGSFLAILAPLGPPGGPLGSKYLQGASLDPPKTLQESLQEPPGANMEPT